ncbi:TPA: hypothetical protein ACF3Y6_003224 [Vibrio parahaemolyticus]
MDRLTAKKPNVQGNSIQRHRLSILSVSFCRLVITQCEYKYTLGKLVKNDVLGSGSIVINDVPEDTPIDEIYPGFTEIN